MKKIILLFALGCASALNAMETKPELIEFEGAKHSLLDWISIIQFDHRHPFSATLVVRMDRDKFVLKGDILSIDGQDLKDIEDNNYVYCQGDNEEVGTIILGTKNKQTCHDLALKVQVTGIDKELLYYIRSLPMELQEEILLSQDAIMFLGEQPIVLTEHTKIVSSVAIAGDKVVTGSHDKTAKIWKVDGQLLHTLKGHTDQVWSVATADNKVVTGSYDNTAKIWNLNTGQLERTIQGHNDLVWAVAIAGDKVVTGSADKTAKIWDINTGQLLHTLKHTDSVNSVAISGDMVVTGSRNDNAKIWDINNGQLLHTLHEKDVDSVAISGNTVVISNGRRVKIWNTHGQLLHTFDVHRAAAVAISGSTIVAGSQDKTIKIWNIHGQLLHTLKDDYIIISVAINGNKVVTGLYNGVAKIWPLKLNLQGAPEDNPLVWIMQKSDMPQLDLIKRACETTKAQQEFILVIPSEDTKVFLSLPMHVKKYLLERLNITLKK